MSRNFKFFMRLSVELGFHLDVERLFQETLRALHASEGVDVTEPAPIPVLQSSAGPKPLEPLDAELDGADDALPAPPLLLSHLNYGHRSPFVCACDFNVTLNLVSPNGPS